MSDSLWPHGLQRARLPCPSPTPGACPNSCPLSQWCHPTISSSVVPFLLPIFDSIRVFSNESVLRIRWPKYWSFSFSMCPSNEYLGLISFMMDWLDFLAVQGTLQSLLQHHSSKASILWRSAFFIVQLSNPYMTTGKTIALTRQTFVGKVMSLLIFCLGWSKEQAFFNFMAAVTICSDFGVRWRQQNCLVLWKGKRCSSFGFCTCFHCGMFLHQQATLEIPVGCPMCVHASL